MRLSQRRFLQLAGRSIAPTSKTNVSLFGAKTWNHMQKRSLHAQWTYLLDHCWIYRQHNQVIGNSPFVKSAWDQCIESDGSQDDPVTRTILFLHDSHADTTMCENFAKDLICKASEDFPSNDRFQVQCLLVNLR